MLAAIFWVLKGPESVKVKKKIVEPVKENQETQ